MNVRRSQSTCRLGLTVLTMALVCAVAPARAQDRCDESIASRAQQDVQRLVQAPYRGDAETVLRFTHPRVVEIQGGSEATRQAIEKVIADVRASKMSVESMTFPEAPACVASGGRRFVLVPTLSIINVGNTRVESLNYQFGVLEPGASGITYIEGSRVNARTVQMLFPGFPKNVKFPPTYRKRI